MRGWGWRWASEGVGMEVGKCGGGDGGAQVRGWGGRCTSEGVGMEAGK